METVLFSDSSEDWLSQYNANIDATANISDMSELTLKDFFRRPVLIDSADWKVGVNLNKTFNPWAKFLNDPRVANRLTNYHLMNGSLHLKFLINGSPFYYGKAIVSYYPLINQEADINTLPGSTTLTRTITTQRLHAYLNPTTNSGCEMVLPYLWFYDHVNLPAGDFNSLGDIYITEFNPLTFANGVAPGTGLTIQIYAWSDDMSMSCVTSQNIAGLVSQSGEYESSPVSSIATTMAKVSGKLDSIPLIGPYAKATSTMFQGISMIAKSLGYSSPAIIDNLTNNHPNILGGIANVDRGDVVQKLSVDSKQELTVDPRTVGLDGEDQMVIKHIATKEAFLDTITWLPADAKDSLKWNARVNPVYSIGNSAAGFPFYLLPCTFAALPFKYWRGTIRYRFEIVCTPYHQGRLRLVFDPRLSGTAPSNASYTRIIDIGKDTEFTLDVGWACEKKFLKVGSLSKTTGAFGFQTAAYTVPDSVYSNGVVALYVTNILSSPGIDNSKGIYINVFVSMTEDCEFADPTESAVSRTSVLVPQSGIIETGKIEDNTKPIDNAVSDAICMTELISDHTYDVYFGEVITSFRQLLHRYNYHSSYLTNPLATGSITYKITLGDFPYYKGRAARGVQTGVPATYFYNVCKTTLLNYLAPAYLLSRGAMRTKYLIEANTGDDVTYIGVCRSDIENVLYDYDKTDIDDSNFLQLQTTTRSAWPTFQNGGHLSEASYQPNLEVEFPFMSNTRASFSRSPGMAISEFSQGKSCHTLYITEYDISANTTIHRLISVGEDFSLFLFQGCPPLYFV